MKTNAELQKDVMHELQFDPVLGTSSTEIGVIVKDGAVTLSGQVNSYTKKLAAERAAKRVKGVKVVAVDIEVVLPGNYSNSDSDIARAVNQAIKWHSAVEKDQIKVKVEDGFVYLDGDVNWQYQKVIAEEAIEDLMGIKGVINRIHIKPATELDTKKLRKDINAAFHRSATIDLENIVVEVDGSKVILSGKVQSWAEKKEAERSAWNAAGVTAVENNLKIDLPVMA